MKSGGPEPRASRLRRESMARTYPLSGASTAARSLQVRPEASRFPQAAGANYRSNYRILTIGMCDQRPVDFPF
jgi:hypothetical protein